MACPWWPLANSSCVFGVASFMVIRVVFEFEIIFGALSRLLCRLNKENKIRRTKHEKSKQIDMSKLNVMNQTFDAYPT